MHIAKSNLRHYSVVPVVCITNSKKNYRECVLVIEKQWSTVFWSLYNDVLTIKYIHVKPQVITTTADCMLLIVPMQLGKFHRVQNSRPIPFHSLADDGAFTKSLLRRLQRATHVSLITSYTVDLPSRKLKERETCKHVCIIIALMYNVMWCMTKGCS